MAIPQCHVIGDSHLSMTEYFDFMDDQGEDGEDMNAGLVTAPSQEVEHSSTPVQRSYDWKTMHIGIDDDFKDFWRQDHLQELNGKLGELNAHASMCNDQSGSLQLKIDPLAGSETMADWEEQIEKAVDNFRLHFKKDSENLPNYGFADLIKYAESAKSIKLMVQVANNVVTLTGEAESVDRVMDTIRKMIYQLYEIKPERRSFPKKHIKYLKKFSTHQLMNNTRIPVEKFILNSDQEIITVEANQEAREAFWGAVEAETSNIKEKTVDLESEAFELLATKQGTNKIEEVIGPMQIVYDLVNDPPSYSLCLLSPSFVPKEKMKSIKTSLKKLIECKKMKIETIQKFRFCKDMKWKEFVGKKQKDVFVLITVDEANQSVNVTGEQVVIEDVLQKIQKYISEQASIREHVLIDGPKWTVISQSCWDDIEAIKHKFQGTNVEVKWPQPAVHTNAVLIIKGDPPLVDKMKGELEALQKKVCEREETLSNIPAVMPMMESMEDTIRALEFKFKASIHFSVKKGIMAGPKLCSGTCPNDVRISVYSGDFTKHNKVDVIINFIPPAPTHQEDNLRLLFDAGGVDLQQDFTKKLSNESPGEIFTCDSGQLQCGKLCHCIIPPWDGSNTKYLESSLSKTLHNIKRCSTVLFTSICSSPLNYPAEVFAVNIVSLVSTNPDISSDMTVAVYVNGMAQAAKFESQFHQSNCRVLSQVQSSATVGEVSRTRSIDNPISSFITLTKGDLLEKQVS